MAKEHKYERVLNLILNDDWHDLLMYLTMEEIKENYIATSSEDYQWEGDYETDARYTFPSRMNLIKAVIKKILSEVDCLHVRTICINEKGNAGVFCADCGTQLEKEC